MSHRIFPYFYDILKTLNKVLYGKHELPPNFWPLSFVIETKSTCQRYITTTSQVMFKQQEGIAVEYTPLLGTNELDKTKVQWIMLSAT